MMKSGTGDITEQFPLKLACIYNGGRGSQTRCVTGIASVSQHRWGYFCKSLREAAASRAQR